MSNQISYRNWSVNNYHRWRDPFSFHHFNRAPAFHPVRFAPRGRIMPAWYYAPAPCYDFSYLFQYLASLSGMPMQAQPNQPAGAEDPSSQQGDTGPKPADGKPPTPEAPKEGPASPKEGPKPEDGKPQQPAAAPKETSKEEKPATDGDAAAKKPDFVPYKKPEPPAKKPDPSESVLHSKIEEANAKFHGLEKNNPAWSKKELFEQKLDPMEQYYIKASVAYRTEGKPAEPKFDPKEKKVVKPKALELHEDSVAIYDDVFGKGKSKKLLGSHDYGTIRPDKKGVVNFV